MMTLVMMIPTYKHELGLYYIEMEIMMIMMMMMRKENQS